MDDTDKLSASLTRELYRNLAHAIPSYPGETAEDRAEHIENAMAAIGALHPEDAYEARVAADIVLAQAAAKDALAQAHEYREDPTIGLRCRAQAISMTRQYNALARDLKRRQAQRDKAYNESHPATMERGGYWFRDISTPLPKPEAAPAHAEAPPPRPEPEEDRFRNMTDAERYAVMYPRRAAAIRAEGRLPPNPGFPPPEPGLVEQLLASTSLIVVDAAKEFARHERPPGVTESRKS
jgi:hypothetical protein